MPTSELSGLREPGAKPNFWVLGFIGALLALPVILLPSGQYGYVMDVAITTTIYMMLALGLNVIVGFAGLLVLGYVAFYAVGAYTVAILTAPDMGVGLPFWVVLPLSGVLAAAFGLLLGAPTLRLRGDYLAIVTLGFGEIVRVTLNNLEGLTRGPQGISGIPKPVVLQPAIAGDGRDWTSWGFAAITPQDKVSQYYLILGMMLLTWLVVHRLNTSRIGRAWVALREDEVAAGAMGLDTVRLKLLAFGASAFFAGFAGAFFAGKQGFISPESFTFQESIIVLAMVVLGGIGSIPGVMLGAVILGLLPELIRAIPELMPPAIFDALPVTMQEILKNFSTYRMLIFGLAMILVMLLRPEGLWGSSRRKAELQPESDAIKHQEIESEDDVERREQKI